MAESPNVKPEPEEARSIAPGPGPNEPSEAPAAPRTRPVRPDEIHHRLTLFVVRALFFLIAGALGLYAASEFHLDPFTTILAGCAFGCVSVVGEMFFSRAPVRTIASIT